MKLSTFKTLWGCPGPIEDAADEAVADGFAGMEGPVPANSRDFADAIRSRGLDLIAEISTTGYATPDPGSTVADHLDAFERLLARSLDAEPLLITTMAGSDLWTFRESVDFLTRAHEIAMHYRARVGFETHRSRSLFHPVVTRELLRELPPIELTLDLSHWCVVTERLVLDELPEILALVAGRALHLHARVGYDQGPQVPDPRAPEYSTALDAHLRWWRTIWDSQRERGFEMATMTPEFGPDGYLHLEPHTKNPVADLRDVNRWMGARLQTEFSDWAAQT